MKILSILFLLLPIFTFGQDDCERLFHQYNPSNNSMKTTSLVISHLSKNCNEGEVMDNQVATARNFNNHLLSRTNNGMATQSSKWCSR